MTFQYTFSSSSSGANNSGYVNVTGLDIYISQYTASQANVDYVLNPALAPKSIIYLNSGSGIVYTCLVGMTSPVVNPSSRVQISCDTIILEPGQAFGNGQTVTVVIVEAPLLNEISDVDITLPLVNGEVLTYDSGTSKWVNLPGGGGGGGEGIHEVYPLSGPAFSPGDTAAYIDSSSEFANIPGSVPSLIYSYDATAGATPGTGKFGLVDSSPAPGTTSCIFNVIGLDGRDNTFIFTTFPFKFYTTATISSTDPGNRVSFLFPKAETVVAAPYATFELPSTPLNSSTFVDQTVCLFTLGTGNGLYVDNVRNNINSSAFRGGIPGGFLGLASNNIMYQAGGGVYGQSNCCVGGFGSGSTSSSFCTTVGYNALNNQSTNGNNTAIGFSSQLNSTTSTSNTAVGARSLSNNVTGNANVAIGSSAMQSVSGTISNCVGIGEQALRSSTANNNVAVGYQAMLNSTGETEAVAVGALALQNLSIPLGCVAVGYNALNLKSSGTASIAIGNNALAAESNGGDNVAVGTAAGSGINSGAKNIAIGNNVLTSGSSALSLSNIGIGWEALKQSGGERNVCIGESAGAGFIGASNNIAIGYQAMMVGNVTDSSIAIGSNVLEGGSGGTNICIGFGVMAAPSTASGNVVIGDQAGLVLTGSNNIFIGSDTAGAATAVEENVGIGQGCLGNIAADGCVAVGYNSQSVASSGQNCSVGTNSLALLTTGSQNTTLGNGTGSNLLTGNSNVFIGDSAGGLASLAESNNICIGASSSPGLFDSTITIGTGAIGFESNTLSLGGPAPSSLVLEPTAGALVGHIVIYLNGGATRFKIPYYADA